MSGIALTVSHVWSRDPFQADPGARDRPGVGQGQPDDTTRRIEALAETQRGRFTRAQVAEIDPRGRVLVQNRLRSHKWRRETSRVLALPGAPRDHLARMWTAWLHLGPAALVSHFSAARLLGLPVDQEEPDSLTLPTGSHKELEGVLVHQRGDLVAEDRVVLGGLPCTSAERTLFDLGGTVRTSRIEAWMDQLGAERTSDPVAVARVVERLRRQGKHSVPALVRALEKRLGDTGATQGHLEEALREVVRIAGLPAGRVQFAHPGRGARSEFVDRAWPEVRLIVEADGRCWHDRLQAAAKDASRDREAAVQGWMTIRYRHEELVGDPATTGIELAGIYRRRLEDIRAVTPRSRRGGVAQ